MATLTAKDRRDLPSSAYIFPEKAPGPGSYPIPDRAHALAALHYSYGTPDAPTVRAAVKKKFGIG